VCVWRMLVFAVGATAKSAVATANSCASSDANRESPCVWRMLVFAVATAKSAVDTANSCAATAAVRKWRNTKEQTICCLRR
jgi:hypothetical protein